MRFAFAGCDRAFEVLSAFVRHGWEPVRFFSGSAEGSLDSNQKLIEFALGRNLDVQLERMTAQDIRHLGETGCDALIVAVYRWRIPDWRTHLKYAVNFHPSPLPEARGPYPMVRAILENRTSWAVSCHRLDAEFDSGDILDAETFALSADECHERLNLKLQMASGRLAQRLAGDFEQYWASAVPQVGGSYWPNLTPQDRTLDFALTVEHIMRKVRAMGQLECLAHINGVRVCVRRAVGWEEKHERTPGTVVHVHDRSIVVAARDGYIGVLDWILLP